MKSFIRVDRSWQPELTAKIKRCLRRCLSILWQVHLVQERIYNVVCRMRSYLKLWNRPLLKPSNVPHRFDLSDKWTQLPQLLSPFICLRTTSTQTIHLHLCNMFPLCCYVRLRLITEWNQKRQEAAWRSTLGQDTVGTSVEAYQYWCWQENHSIRLHLIK